ncbi:double-strand break repair helicase AddA [Rhizobiales bacterium RZME27]|uniref:DNA 3'-5' helicase n=1 Tax=Endobacterium cereale TaxID=2663029 RepID=A0A6A8A812_9HYPH|nr:double-strand break repair helicase AddA [Endobacterium cereale]MEB2845257.1 double-strand break repair helicase AddA [Endobacterium cereale]MQY46038.1 double-strand break repair helicase AddA [Endobacterium cereale]
MSDLLSQPVDDDPIQWLDWTSVQQSRASDPMSSAWVSANAGSGKTHVLTQRVIRLLLAGCRPSAILCLTYTKAAASEMSNRVFQRLAGWTILSDEALSDQITAMEGKRPDRLMLAEARRLFARALETPGGLKIQTIHAFCEALLHQFPLEANVAGHFSVLDDRAAAALLDEARRSLLTATAKNEDGGLASAFADVLDLGDESGLENLLSDIIANRTALRLFLTKAETTGGTGFTLRKAYGLSADENEETGAAAYWPLPGLSGATLDLYLDLADRSGGVKVTDVAYGMRLAQRETDVFKRAEYLEKILLTKDGKPKADSSLVAKAMLTAAPELGAAVAAARDHVAACRNRMRTLRMVAATESALLLAERLNRDYEGLKNQRSLLDFEDLINRTANLLTRDGVGAWVHYKLDQGIDHILVDEAQDTSPVQWTVIKSLAEDFYGGSSARNVTRTLFAVGDEKQSIYSFQGARPERFAQERDDTQRQVTGSGLSFHSVRLPLSFRSTAEVLSAVDQVFSLEDNARGLSARSETIIHRSNRLSHPGIVDLWDTVVPDVLETEEDWTAPFDSTPDKAPSAILASRMAHAIGAMIAKETVIDHGVERMIRAGDVLVLVRKRDGFVNALTRALKRKGDIPVAGADRLSLTSHIAIQDLLALGRFLLLTGDDLSLVSILKSPLFDLSEDDVFEIAGHRPEKTSVWAYLRTLAADNPKLQAVVDRLQRYIALSRTLNVHDLFAHLLGADGGRRQFLARLGSEAGDILDEFLTFAMDHETSGLPGLQAFISTLELESPVIKREQDSGRNEVRIMTVHASKGLEAPVVFLVDSGSKAFVHSHISKLRMLRVGDMDVPAWLPSKAVSNGFSDADEERLKIATDEEYRRLLYVGMTRAADRLVICGYRGKRENPESWQAMVARALSANNENCRPAEFAGPDGNWTGLSWRLSGKLIRPVPKEELSPTIDDSAFLPDALSRPLPPQKMLPRPLSPSGAGAMIDDEANDALFTSPLFSEAASPDHSLQRGRMTHRMLQMLPDFPETERQAAAERYSARAVPFWPEKERRQLVTSVMAVLSAPDLREAFSDHAQAEVSIMGTLKLDGRDYAVSGRIDRLVANDTRVMIMDYKTDRRPPKSEEQTSFSHRAQLAIYREILRPLYPGRAIDCVLVYTESGHAIRLSDDLLSRSLLELRTK